MCLKHKLFHRVIQSVWTITRHFHVFNRSEYVRESELAAPSAWHQQQFCGYCYSGAFLRSNIHWVWLLSLQTKVWAGKSLNLSHFCYRVCTKSGCLGFKVMNMIEFQND